MSLLGRRKLYGGGGHLDSSGKTKKKGGGLSQRQKPKVFKICENELEMDQPILGGSSGSSGLSFFSSTSSTRLEPSFTSFSTPRPTSTSSESRSVVDAALASSKLNGLTSEGPIEPNPRVGKRKQKAAKKFAKSLTKGPGWYNMAKVEITKDKKNDLDVLKYRSAMDGVLHYKRNHMTHTPKYFHVGKVVETSADFYSSRIPKKQRKKTLAQEFAAEVEMG